MVSGTLPYVFLMIGFTVLLIIWPDIATWLPTTMSAP
jgi:C4-dicarboxylate transporter, DctM subunit